MMRRGALLLLAATMATSGCGYNEIQTKEQQVDQAKGQIEAQLQRRADLIPNLVATVKGVAQQESTIFIRISENRGKLVGAVKSGDLAGMAAANQAMSGDLTRILGIVENYPQLKSDQSFRDLQSQLEGTENRVAVARTDYNAAVGQYNTAIVTFPSNLTAKIFGKQTRPYFEADANAKAGPPQVKF